MRVYTHDELDRLRLIKHLVDEAGVNLAGVQRLLESAEAVATDPAAGQGRAPGVAAGDRVRDRAHREMLGFDGIQGLLPDAGVAKNASRRS